ncbi:transcriptional regulator [Opitutaceae bacterium TAV1]|nr:transcriptional regulator [Opitutaceae bacterium TAV1]
MGFPSETSPSFVFRHPSRVTIRDVAKRAGVTLTTVSSALSGRGRVSDEKRENIRKIANELGYQPKLAAQMMRGRSTGHIGLILPGFDVSQISMDGHAGPILQDFILACEKRDITYHIEYWDASKKDRFEPPKQIANGLTDAVVVGGYVSPEFHEYMKARQITWVSIDEPATYCVLSATDEGIYQATQHLAALGHRKIAYVGDVPEFTTQKLGLEGFHRAQTEFGIKHPDRNWIKLFAATDYRQVREDSLVWAGALLTARVRPTAIVCHGMVMARSIIHQALLLGIKIPDELSIIALGVAGEAERAPPPISSIEVNFADMMEQAMNMLLQSLNGTVLPPKTYRIPPKIVMRKTVAPVSVK